MPRPIRPEVPQSSPPNRRKPHPSVETSQAFALAPTPDFSPWRRRIGLSKHPWPIVLRLFGGFSKGRRPRRFCGGPSLREGLGWGRTKNAKRVERSSRGLGMCPSRQRRPRSGRTNTMPCGFGMCAVCNALRARNLRTARSCLAEGRPKGSAPQGLTGNKKMWKGSGWALDQP